jgi:hypothetical protein
MFVTSAACVAVFASTVPRLARGGERVAAGEVLHHLLEPRHVRQRELGGIGFGDHGMTISFGLPSTASVRPARTRASRGR